MKDRKEGANTEQTHKFLKEIQGGGALRARRSRDLARGSWRERGLHKGGKVRTKSPWSDTGGRRTSKFRAAREYAKRECGRSMERSPSISRENLQRSG